MLRLGYVQGTSLSCQTSLPLPSQAVMGAALPAGAVGWDWLVPQPWAQPPKITQECKSLRAAGTAGMDVMSCWLGWRKYISKPWQGEENVQDLV